MKHLLQVIIVIVCSVTGWADVAKETDTRLHADGGRWGLRKADSDEPRPYRVLLIGDSIMNGYRLQVAEALAEVAAVDGWLTPAHLNSGGLRDQLAEIVSAENYDVIHFNIGLHGWQPGRIPEGQYETLLEQYVNVLMAEAPQAALIWASTTPMMTDQTPRQLDPVNNPTIVERNSMAAALMKEKKITVNDLYAMAAEMPHKAVDQFHWPSDVKDMQAEYVAAAIRQALDNGSKPTGRTAPIELTSPDGMLKLTIGVRSFGEEADSPYYRVTYDGRTVLTDSPLGLALEDGTLRSGMTIRETDRSRHDSTWEPVCGERHVIRDHYHQVVVECTEKSAPNRRLLLTFRAYNEGIAFAYTLPEQAGMEKAVIRKELSEFRFEEDYTTWATYFGQGKYEQIPLSQVKARCERPLVVQLANDLYAALAEAKLVDYARMKFDPVNNVPYALQSGLEGAVESTLPLTTPWRVVMAAESPGRLLENNFIILNLNEPCAIDDTSWIKPGKVIREVTLTTAGGKACVDFAVERGLQYVEYDAGWYGHEYDAASDARAVNLDTKRSKGPLDLHEVIRYADERGIGVLVYVNHLALEKQLDDLLPLYKEWGLKGIKFGFVNVGSQQWTAWLHEAIRKCADYQMMVDVHDEYRPTGYSRTYPNFMTMEGIAGDEATPSNELTLTYLFTRMLAGQADHTVCYYNNRVHENATHAYQLAKPVCFFSPWQFLFWYDRPSAAPKEGDGGVPSKGRIGTEPELEFWNDMPTVWDDTRVLEGAIGRYAVIARRSGRQWYIGCMNAEEPQTFEVPLDFLEPGQTYTASIYKDDPSVPTRTRVRKEQMTVDQNTRLKVPLGPRQGQAIRIVPL